MKGASGCEWHKWAQRVQAGVKGKSRCKGHQWTQKVNGTGVSEGCKQTPSGYKGCEQVQRAQADIHHQHINHPISSPPPPSPRVQESKHARTIQANVTRLYFSSSQTCAYGRQQSRSGMLWLQHI